MLTVSLDIVKVYLDILRGSIDMVGDINCAHFKDFINGEICFIISNTHTIQSNN
jgi:hypothetical protein